jgi:transposase-like protein
MEQRYRAVVQVQSGVPVTEVADAFGVSRQAVHRWLRWYRGEGLAWPTGRTGRTSIHGRSTRRWKRPSARCAGTIPGGANGGWRSSWVGGAARVRSRR